MAFAPDRPQRVGRSNRVSLRPELEPLENRSLLSVGQVPSSFLFTPIPDGATLAEHIHPHLTILIDGQPQVIPEGIGIEEPAGDLPLHTHSPDGTIHIESTVQLPFRLQDFFTVWGQTFNSHEVLGHVADARHRITMTVNGLPSRAFGSLLLHDLQDIIIRYDTVPLHNAHPAEGGQVPSSLLFTPIPVDTPLAEIIEPHLTILIDGQPQVIPEGIGIEQAGAQVQVLPLNTVNPYGTIFVISPVAPLPAFRLQDFFTIWGQTFNSHEVLGHFADAQHRITMTVNGLPSRAFGTLPLQDLQDIVIRYDTVPRSCPEIGESLH
jgi:hypothetical protein